MFLEEKRVLVGNTMRYSRITIGIILVVIGVLLIIFSYTFTTHMEPQTFQYSGEHSIPPNRYYRSCLPLAQGDDVTISIHTNKSIGLAFVPTENIYDTLKGKQYSVITPPTAIYSTTINSTQEYCLLIINEGIEGARVSYTMNITRDMLVEENSLISILGLVSIGLGISVLYSIPLSKTSKYSDIITSGNITCRTRSLNKHECLIYIGEEELGVEETVSRVVNFMTKYMGYREKKKLGDTIVFLEKKGGILPTRDFAKKGRTVIVSIEPGILRLNYIISMASASGVIDLKGVYDEVKTIENFLAKNMCKETRTQ